MRFFNNKIKLPQNEKEFDDLVTLVVNKYNLTDAHHAAAIISVAIRHLDNSCSYTTLDYLGQSVQKNIANYVANHKAEILRHESQVTQLYNMLTTDPNNMQARDELEKAAREGSPKAREALDKLYPSAEPLDNVTTIGGTACATESIQAT